MKLSPEQILKILSSNTPYRKFLIFGPEQSAVESSSKRMAYVLQKKLNLSVRELNYSDVKNSLSDIVDLLNTKSLFGEEALVFLTSVSGVLPKELIEICRQGIKYGYLIVSAGDLGKTSPLRKYAEESSDMAAVACYKLDEKAVYHVIDHKFKELGITAGNEIIYFIMEMVPYDRSIIEIELEKIALYKGDDKKLTPEDIVACLAYSGEASIDNLINSIVSKNLHKKAAQMNNILHSDMNFMLIIRSLLNFFNKLLQVHNISYQKGISLQGAVQTLKPPLFFKARDNMLLACKNFSLPQTKLVINRLIELERRCKSGANPQLLLQHFLLRAV